MTPHRTKDWQSLDKVMTPFKHEWLGFDPEKLVADEDNILLTDGEDNYGLFEYRAPGEYDGHYLFGNARGEQAVTTAKQLLRHFFLSYPVEIIYGLTPVEHTGALRMNKRIGLVTIATVQTKAGPCERVFLTKEGFFNNE